MFLCFVMPSLSDMRHKELMLLKKPFLVEMADVCISKMVRWSSVKNRVKLLFFT